MKHWCDFIGGKMWLDPEASEFEALMAAGQWEHRKIALLQKYLKPGMTFVDAGAHWGYFSLIAASLGAEVIAFEPDRENNEQLKTNANQNGYSIEVWSTALWKENDRRPMYPGFNSATHSLTRDALGASHQLVCTQTLDFYSRMWFPDMMKIDVEGADIEVLIGAEETLTRAKNMVIVMDLHPELGVHNEDVGELLRGHGFRLYDIRSDNAPIVVIPPTMVELLALKGHDA